ncbi:variable surface protein [Plasmodium gonderi]|uniref:Variable surface protein n=1 Tax=Plasmodium gonderi TaxID=77519 RepID=A0A1Y1JNX9_PLAGO|nr:variable surface protein [Plasmodium gonderi]GAW83970.1 variable surface protein [Plasmodium gonderi]
MTTHITINNDFDFDGIFTNCIQDYDEHALNREKLKQPELLNTCKRIREHLGNCKVGIFLQYCKELILYLDHIQDIKGISDINPSCIFFNYMLKYLLKTSECSIQETDTAYKKMINETKEGTNKKVSDVCESGFTNLEDDIYSLLDKLKNLYINSLGVNVCSKESFCFTTYKELLGISERLNNDSLRTFLDNFKFKYMTYLPEVQERLKLMVHSTNLRTILLALFIITFTTLIVTFVVYQVKFKIYFYNYTSYVSYLQKKVMNIKKRLNKKNKDHFNTTVSSQFIKNDSLQNKYQIGCSSLLYP